MESLVSNVSKVTFHQLMAKSVSWNVMIIVSPVIQTTLLSVSLVSLAVNLTLLQTNACQTQPVIKLQHVLSVMMGLSLIMDNVSNASTQTLTVWIVWLLMLLLVPHASLDFICLKILVKLAKLVVVIVLVLHLVSHAMMDSTSYPIKIRILEHALHAIAHVKHVLVHQPFVLLAMRILHSRDQSVFLIKMLLFHSSFKPMLTILFSSWINCKAGSLLLLTKENKNPLIQLNKMNLPS